MGAPWKLPGLRAGAFLTDYEAAVTIARLLSEKTGNEREAMHRFDASSRQLTDNTNATGLRGEHAFGEIAGVYPDTSRKRNGDGGIDYVMPLLFSIDVKTRKERKGGLADTFLLVEEGKTSADIYVLAILSSDGDRCECVGWMSKQEIVKYPVSDLGTGVRNHQVPALRLRQMAELKRRFPKWELP